MKSVQQLKNKLAAQWLSADYREQRLLLQDDWPLRLVIGKPNAKMFTHQSPQVQQHLADWRKQTIGQVEWQPVKYQSASQPVDMPIYWLIDDPQQWITACDDRQIKAEFKQLTQVLQQSESMFHQLIIRHRRYWSNIDEADHEIIIRSCRLAMLLEPGIGMGRPLRAVSITDFDSKFLEKQRGILTQLLNIRFSDALQGISLEEFLGASEKGQHWLLLKPMVKGLMPFDQVRLRASELAQTELPTKNLIVVENEQCLHQLPELDNTIAILGAGLNLGWLANPHFKTKKIIYWGDIDSWGLKMLAMARQYQPHLIAVLMELSVYNQYHQFAVPEPSHAGDTCPEGLTEAEMQLYQILLKSTKGRLEQEVISVEHVRDCLQKII